MQTQKIPPEVQPGQPIGSHDQSIGSVVREVTESMKDLVQSEVNLVVAEVKESSQYLGKHSAMAAVFGAILALSVLPFLAFLVIGLGNILGGNFWLSSLIVATLCAVIGGGVAYREYKKIKNYDASLPTTRHSLERSRSIVSDKTQEVKSTAQQDMQEVKNVSKRRAA